MSTIRSFKGWEAENVFLVLENSKGHDEETIDENSSIQGLHDRKINGSFLISR
ncbi:hypothetical protein J2S09_003756 [Bacillus fengqiuensis]|nr:hypothetical protein [Bacillus fengqiuensis]